MKIALYNKRKLEGLLVKGLFPFFLDFIMLTISNSEDSRVD